MKRVLLSVFAATLFTLMGVAQNKSGAIIEYTSYGLDSIATLSTVSLEATMCPQGINGYVDIYLDAPTIKKGGTKLGTLYIPREDEQIPQTYSTPLHGLQGVKGKHALYFVFYAEIKEKPIATLYDFHFVDQSGLQATIHPYLQNPQPTEMTIMWLSTSDNQTGYVEYGQQTLDHTAREGRNGILQAYNQINRVTLTDLKPGTTYSYRIVARNIDKVTNNSLVYTTTEYSDIYTFTTPQLNPASLSMLVFDDIHQKTFIPGELMHRNHLKAADQDFIVFNGDMLNGTESHEALQQYLIDPYSLLFASRVPFMYSRGNHDLRNKQARHLEDYVTTPGTKDDHPFYYSFTWGPCFVVVLDAGEDKEDTDYEYGGLIECESYREAEAAWLRDQLQSKAARQASFRIAIMHIPPFFNNNGNERYTPGRIRALFLETMNKGKVDVLLSGHTHHESVLEANDQHHFPIVINGGHETGPGHAYDCPSVIQLKADKHNLQVDILDYDQQNRGSVHITR